MKTVSVQHNNSFRRCFLFSNIVKDLRTLLYCLGTYLGRFEKIWNNFDEPPRKRISGHLKLGTLPQYTGFQGE